MTILFTILGIALVAVVLRDVFFTVFSPSGRGMLISSAVKYLWRAMWRASRHHTDRLALAGPACLVLIILLWVFGLILGWACIFWPHLPEQFLLAPGLAPERNAGFLDVLYVSTVTIGTLGYGDLTPQATWLRVITPLEALIGFTLFTASISWILSIYPSLARRRHLAREIALLARSAERAGQPIVAMTDRGLLQQLTMQVISVGDDFVQYPITYYFRDSDQAAALDAVLPTLVALARDASRHGASDIRAQGLLLVEALDDLISYLGRAWLDCGADARIGDVLDAYAADHLRQLDTIDSLSEAADERDPDRN